MAEYTPTTEQVRHEWVESVGPGASETVRLHAGAAFDRWVAVHKTEVRGEVAQEIEAERLDTDHDALGADAYLNGLERAEKIAKEGR